KLVLRNIFESDQSLPIGVPELTRQTTGRFCFAVRQTRLQRHIAEVPGGDFSRPNIGFALSGKIRRRESAAVDFNQRAYNSLELLSIEQFEQVDLGDF